MRKHQQKQILELIETLNEAQAAGLYAQAQEGAVAICGFIDEIEGQGTHVAVLFKEYGELLFKASIGEVKEKVLKKQLNKIENAVSDELKQKKTEIVFISYKASMSDSILSMYMAAKDDPDCDAIWLPVPYFERNMDGSLGVMHYEGAECYSDEVECMDWLQYNIKDRRPDAIVTFNPYDSGNLITSIHPNFYCEQLQKLTDLLIYIPYFVTVGDVQGHFCVTAGCAFAHKVILQNERVRDTYIRVFKETYGDKFGRPEEKFIAAGSPKYDAIISAKRNSFQLPDNWKKLIGNKKVVFYNTSIGSLLEGDWEYLEKIRYVLNAFRVRNDIALLWRPHPLNEAAYKTMRPQLLSEYEKIISEYKLEAWGIYDDSPDLHRAIAISDAYYGDWSSIVSMFQVTGKDIMIANNRLLTDEISFMPAGFYIDDTGLFTMMRQINGLFKLDKENLEPCLIGSFPEEDFANKNILYQDIVACDNKFYFSPFGAENIGSYDFINDEFTMYAYEKTYDRDIGHRDFCGIVVYGDYIYFTPYLYCGILRLDTLTKETVCYTDWVEPINELAGHVEDAYFIFPAKVGASIWLASCRANAVIEFNMETERSVVYEVGGKEYRYNGISYDGESFWLTPRINTLTPIVKWNPEKGVMKEFCDIYKGDSGAHGFTPGVLHNGFMWFLPSLSRCAYKINVQTDSIYVADEFELTLCEGELAKAKYFKPMSFGDCIYAYNELRKTLVEYNTGSGEYKEKQIEFSQEILNYITDMIKKTFIRNAEEINCETDCYYYESEIIRLVDFFDYIADNTCAEEKASLCAARRKIAKEINCHVDGMAGQAIYDFTQKIILE